MPEHVPSDHDLLEAWRAGDRQAGERLIRRHFADVHTYFARRAARLHPGLEPGELAQRTFAAMVAVRDRFGGEFRPYLFGIARIQLRRAYGEIMSRAEQLSPSRVGLSDPRTSVSRLFARRQEAERISAAIADLPKEFRSVLDAYYVKGRSVGAISAALKMPIGTVKSRLSRGRARLRERLGVEVDGEGAS